MPSRRLVWFREAVSDYHGFLSRRTDKAAVRRCVEQNLLAVAGDLSLARPWEGPGDFYIFRFTCSDGDVALFVQAVLECSDGLLGVLTCNSVRF